MNYLETLLKQTADRYDYQHTANHEPTFWLRCRLVSMVNTAKPCGHPKAVLAALWSELIACPSCAPAQRAKGEDDFTCDRCGVVEHPITACGVAWNGLLISFGLCTSCTEAEYKGAR